MDKRDFYLGILLGSVMSIYGNIWVNYLFDFSRGLVREDVWFGMAAPIALVFATAGLLFVGYVLWSLANRSENE